MVGLPRLGLYKANITQFCIGNLDIGQFLASNHQGPNYGAGTVVVSSSDSDSVQRNFLDLLSIIIKRSIAATARQRRNQENIGWKPLSRYQVGHRTKLLGYWIFLFYYLKHSLHSLS